MTQILSTESEVLLLNRFGRNWNEYEPTIANIRTMGRMRTQQSPYKIVGDCGDKDGHDDNDCFDYHKKWFGALDMGSMRSNLIFWFEIIGAKPVLATKSFYFVRGIGSQACDV